MPRNEGRTCPRGAQTAHRRDATRERADCQSPNDGLTGDLHYLLGVAGGGAQQERDGPALDADDTRVGAVDTRALLQGGAPRVE